MEPELGSRDWRTLELAPLWVLCAVTGRQSGFHPLELAGLLAQRRQRGGRR